MTGPTADPERGAAAVIIAGSLIFLFGMAALAVDTSDFYQTARVNQTTADLACLAGAPELPDDNAAISMAVAYTKANWPEMASAALTISGQNGTLTDGNGNLAIYESRYGGDPEVMRVHVTKRNPTTFGTVLGTESVDVSQEAFCRATKAQDGAGGIPMGVLPGGFDGKLFGPNPCDTGNCGGLRFGGNGANVFEQNIINGIPRELGKHHGLIDQPDPDSNEIAVSCGSVGNGGKCHRTDTEPGLNTGKLRSGMMTRLKNTSVANQTCHINDPPNSGTVDCDTPPMILGGTPTQVSGMGNAPEGWDNSLHGAWPSDAWNHFWYNGQGVKCDSPRLARVPIVSSNLSWKLGDPNPGWPGGSSTQVKFIGFLDVIIVDMTDWDVVSNGGIDKSVSAIVVWYGPNATCSDGTPIYSVNHAHGGRASVKLVSQTD